jgi:TnsA endonuclease N terminal
MATGKYHQGVFTPKNPNKLQGNPNPTWRSSWELRIMTFLDTHPNVIGWASEAIRIPYRNPLTGKQSMYVPDFLVVYQDKKGQQRTELVEVKPNKETFMEAAKSRRDKAAVILNMAKWTAAMAWANKHGVTFRVINENSIFQNKGKP